MKNKNLYYFLSYTWGIIMVLIGLIVKYSLLAFHKIYFKILKKKSGIEFTKHGPCTVIKVGKYWGGLSLGLTVLTDVSPSEHTLNHEFGHSIQNAILGPLFPFVVAIPSAIRYHGRNYLSNYIRKNKIDKKLKPYDSIWFEGSATKLGNKYIEYFK